MLWDRNRGFREKAIGGIWSEHINKFVIGVKECCGEFDATMLDGQIERVIHEEVIEAMNRV